MKLESLQAYADKVAVKLGIPEQVCLKWIVLPCKLPHSSGAHCHTQAHDNRGQICLRRNAYTTVTGWHRLITHEVLHLKVRDHNSVAFKRWMVKFGQASTSERQVVLRANARSGKRHTHVWMYIGRLLEPIRHCYLCKREQVGTTTWKER